MAWKDIESAPLNLPLRLKGKGGTPYAGGFYGVEVHYRYLNIIMGPYFMKLASTLNPSVDMPTKWRPMDD